MAAAEFEDQAALEALVLDERGQAAEGRRVAEVVGIAARVHHFHAEHQATATDIAQLRVVGLQILQVAAQTLAHGFGVGRDVLPVEVADHRRAGGHGHLVATEGAGVGARLPLVEPVLVDHHRQRQAAADGLGQHHHVGNDAGVLEGEHLAGAGEAALDLVDDQGDAQARGEFAQATEPGVLGRDHTALALHRLDYDGRRRQHSTFGVGQQVLDIAQVDLDPRLAAEAEGAAVVVGERQELHVVVEQRAQGLLRSQVAHQRQGALAHAVVAALEGQHGAAAGGGAHQLQRGFHGVGAGGAAELDLRFLGKGRRQHGEQVLDEGVLHRRGEVEGVQRQFVGQNLADCVHHYRVVVAEGQGAGTGQAVDEGAALDVFDVDATGALERQGNAPRVAAGIGLLLLLALQQRVFLEAVEGFGFGDQLLCGGLHCPYP
ncbi:hypothetical protein FQZ97_512030 [compost metagenome]